MKSNAAPTYDVFEATRRLDDLWNSRARAVGADMIEWECKTWGSGDWRGARDDYVLFRLMAERYDLDTRVNWEERDELIVLVPLDLVDQIFSIIEQLDEDWPWLVEDLTRNEQLAIAAKVLYLDPGELEGWDELVEMLRFEDE